MSAPWMGQARVRISEWPAGGRAGSAPRRAFPAGAELHGLARERDVNRRLDSLDESLRLAARTHLPSYCANLVRVRSNYRGGLHELVDHVGGLDRTRGEAVADVHDCELRVVVIAHDQLLVRGDAGVAREA